MRNRVRRLVGVLAVAGVIGIFAVGLGLAVLLAWASRDLPDPSRLIERAVPQSTKIFDRTGERLLFEFHGEEQRTWRSLDDVSRYATWATIATEDRHFYEHRGFRLLSFFRAAFMNVVRGGRAQGGSTITQQLVKNAVLTPEKTYRRKLRELLIAYQLEQRFTKDEILTMYLNEIPYGSTSYGIEAAAQRFFGKGAGDLDIAESAMLAALPQATTRYSPYGSNTDLLVARTQYVIDTMAELGYISVDEAASAKTVDVLSRVQPHRDPIIAPHFVMEVRDILTELYGERMVEQGGLTVRTTLDLTLQEAAETAIATHGEKNAERYNATNAALVAIDPHTGQILALVGSRDFFDEAIDGQVNVAVRPRQPGSSFKPIVYAAAFARGYTPDTLLADVDTTFPTPVGAYEPANYDGKERGFVTLRTALAGSLNIPAVKVLDLVGVDRALDFAERLGYTTFRDRSRFGLSLVLGGGEVRLLEHTAAYAAFAAEGVHRPVAAILHVEDRSGNTLLDWKQQHEERVVDAEVVRQLTNVLIDNDARAFVFGPSSPLAFSDRRVAAKTGTTNDYRDAWTMGYTPSLAWGVWAGNNDNHPMNRAGGSLAAAPMWRSFADAALKGTPVETFEPPGPPTTDKPILRGVQPGHISVRIDRTSGKRATDLTPADQIEERTYEDLHSILHYVRRDDPRGPPPNDPTTDPMYGPWEEGVRRWAQRNAIVLGSPPATIDDIHTEANRPVVIVVSPTERQLISGRTLTLEGTVTAPRGVTQLRVTLDGVAAALFAPAPDGGFHQLVRLPTTIDRGMRSVVISATDDVGNVGVATINVDVQSEREPSSLSWVAPPADAVLSASAFPVTLELRANASTGANRLDITMTESDGTTRPLTSVVPPAGGTIRVLWPRPPTTGRITLRAALFLNDASISESGSLSLVVE